MLILGIEQPPWKPRHLSDVQPLSRPIKEVKEPNVIYDSNVHVLHQQQNFIATLIQPLLLTVVASQQYARPQPETYSGHQTEFLIRAQNPDTLPSSGSVIIVVCVMYTVCPTEEVKKTCSIGNLTNLSRRSII